VDPGTMNGGGRVGCITQHQTDVSRNVSTVVRVMVQRAECRSGKKVFLGEVKML